MPKAKNAKKTISTSTTTSRRFPSACRSTTKRKAKDAKENNDDEEIRYGALEIVAVFTGEDDGGNDDKENKPYSFVMLCSDLMQGDKDTESTFVEWLEYNDKGYLEQLDLDSYEISIGAMICAVTTDVIEFSGQTYKVPDALHARLKIKLEKQLSGDAEVDDDDKGMTYERRMRIVRKRNGKRIKMEDEDDDDGDDAKSKPKRGENVRGKKEDSNDDGGDSKKKRDTVKKKIAFGPSSRGKARLTPRPDFKQVNNPWMEKTGKLNSFNGDTHRASKEVIRAYLSKDSSAFKKILADKKVVADLFANQSCDVQMNVVKYAFLAEDRSAVKTLLKEIATSNVARPPFPECTLFEITSGKHTSKYADYNRSNIGVSRGSKEGNNAFIADMKNNAYSKGTPSQDANVLIELLRTHDTISTSFIEYLDIELFDGSLFSWGFDYQKILKYGHQNLAQSAMKPMLDRGAGLNQLHIDSLGEGHTIEKILAVSVEKKSGADGSVRFCPVHCAASNSNPTYLKQFLAVKPDAVNCVDSEEASLVHYAAVGDQPDTLDWLLKGPGAVLNRNAKMRKGEKSTPLMWAVQAARAKNVRILCEGQSDDMFKIKDVNGRTAFHYIAYSSRERRLETAKALMECGASPNIHGDARLLNKQTPLMICAARGDLDLLKVLVEGGGSLNVVDKLGRSPLMFAAKNGHVHVLSYVLQAGVSAEAEDTSANTAMHYATAYGWVDCVKTLVEVGAHVDPKNSWASTPLELALKKGRFACAVVLLKEKVDVNIRDKNGVSLFNSLVSSFMIQLSKNKHALLPWAVKQIIGREDLDVTCVDSSEQTVLHHIAKGAATEAPILKLVDRLLSRGADPLKKNKDGKVPAEVALKNNNLQLCLKFLQHASHADLHERGENLMHLLMPNITKVDKTLFMTMFSLLHKCNSNWSKNEDNAGTMPLLYGAREVRTGWNKYSPKGKGKDVLENLFDALPERLGDISGRLAQFQNRSNDLIKLIKDGKSARYEPSEEYMDGSRTVLHEILQCPDVVWAFQMSSKIIKETDVSLLHLKTNKGQDAVAFAFDSFIYSRAPVKPILKLLQLLHDNGAPMNSVQHPLFSSLSEAQGELPEVQFNEMDCSIDDTCAFVQYQEKKRVKKLLADKSKSFNQLTALFTPRLIQILNREEARRPSLQLLKGLIEECGLSPNIRDTFGNTVLHLVKDLKVVEQLIPLSDINATNSKGETPLILAVEQTALAKLLITNGADVNIACAKGTALHAAVLNGSSGVVEQLVETCKIDITDDEGRTALHHAAALRAVSRDDMLNPTESLLLKHGANVNVTDKYGRTPLHYCFFPTYIDTACVFPPADPRDPIDMVTALAGKDDIDFDKADKHMRTPLHYAAAVGASICVLYLCESSGKSLHSVDSDNNTPLALALRAERADIATLLISKGSKLNVQVYDVIRTRTEGGTVKEISKKMQSTLWFALKGSGCESVARYMLAKKLPMYTILSSLLSTGNFQLAMQQIKLCGAKEKLQAPDKKTGKTGLHCLGQVESFSAAPAFGPALVDSMVDCGISVATKCKKGRTILHEASFRGHVELCCHLISTHKADVDVEDLEGQTPLSRMFDGSSISARLLCVLAEASEDSKVYVNAAVKRKFCETKEKKWKDIENVGELLLSTPNNLQHAEEEFIKSLLKEREKPTNEKQIITKSILSTPLIEGVLRNDAKLVNTLLSFGANSDAADENGRTALHHAVISGNTYLLNLLLRWKCDSLNTVDKFGRSPLSYAMLLPHKAVEPMMEHLFDYGSDPLVGNVLELAIRMNRQSIVERMLRISRRILLQSKRMVNSYKAGDIAWVRHHDCTSWELTTVISANGLQLEIDHSKDARNGGSLLPEINTDISTNLKRTNEEMDSFGSDRQLAQKKKATAQGSSIMGGIFASHPTSKRLPGNKAPAPVTHDQRFKTINIQDISNVDICIMGMDMDVVIDNVEDMLLPLMPAQLSLEENQTVIKEYEGNETGLQDKLKAGLQKEALVSKLVVGDNVGHLVTSSYTPMLRVGKVTAVHVNGQYDVELLNGQLMKQTSRIQLRPLRKELCIPTKPNTVNFGANLVHACVRPVEYGAFEDLRLLQALIKAGAPADGKNEKGKTPLDLARPGSEIQAYLQKVTNSRQGRSLQAPSSVPCLDGINFKADADAEHMATLASGASSSEQVVPKVSSVCEKLDSDGTCVLADLHDFFDVTLTKVDVEHGKYGKYVFYKMQIIHDPIRNTYILLTNWGRIGESGKYQQTPFTSEEDCVKEYKKVFKSKSGNEWDTRASFIRKAGKYALIMRPKTRLKNPEKLLQGAVESSTHPCSLPTGVGNLLRFFLNTKALSSVYSCSGIDSSRLPFGQLTLSTIQAAEAKLSEIKKKLTLHKEVSRIGGNVIDIRASFETIAKLSNEFYELLPTCNDQILKPFNEQKLGWAVKLTQQLRELTITKQLLLGARHRQASMNPIDYAYKVLGVHIKPLTINSIERKCLLRFIDNTYSDRDKMVHQIYALDDGKQACDIPNKRLLFHGSGNENIPGILKHGLLIAPPEAPTSGWAYGKGIYFSDQFKKAISYASMCSSSEEERPRALVFVAEVALGESYLPSGVEYMEQSPEGTHSTLALGEQSPDKARELILDATGSNIPLGKLKKSKIQTQKSKWSKYQYQRWNTNATISDENSAKIEKIRLDTSTKFPASIQISHDDKEQTITLVSPHSKTGRMIPSKEEDNENVEMEDADDKIRIDIFSDSDSSSDPSDPQLFRIENTDNHITNLSEFIVYDTKQVRLKYLIEMTSTEWLTKEFNKKNSNPDDSGEAEAIYFSNQADKAKVEEIDLFSESSDDSSEDGDY